LVPGDTNGHRDIFVRNTTTGTTTRVSVATDGTQANGDSFNPAISEFGRYVVFESDASNLVPGDTNGCRDIFIRDLQMNTTTRVSVDSHGVQANGNRFTPSVCPDNGEDGAGDMVVAFASDATNLDPSAAAGFRHVYMHNVEYPATWLVSPAGQRSNSWAPFIGSSATWAAYSSDAPTFGAIGRSDVWYRDFYDQTFNDVSVGNLGALNGSSDHGTLAYSQGYEVTVSFDSFASNAVIGDTNGCEDTFVHYFNNTTVRTSVASDGTQGNGASSHSVIDFSGTFVAFQSDASNLVAGDTNGCTDVFLRDLTHGLTTRVSVATDGTQGNGNSSSPSISYTGDYVAFQSDASNLVPDDTNGCSDIFLHNCQNGVTTRVSVAYGAAGSVNPSLSADGRFLAFQSRATDLVPGDTKGLMEVYVKDLKTGTVTRASVAPDGTPGNADCLVPSISADGRYVAFESNASNLVTKVANTQIYVRDSQAGSTTLVSAAADGTPANGASYFPALSADGEHVAFVSWATNFSALTSPTYSYNIFVKNLLTGSIKAAMVSYDGSPLNYGADNPVISADGRYVAFDTFATNLVPTPVFDGVYVRDMVAGTTTVVSVATDGTPADSNNSCGSISADGQRVVFLSIANNLSPLAPLQAGNVFMRDLKSQTTTYISVGYDGSEGMATVGYPTASSADGRYVAFVSNAANMVPGDTNGVTDVFVRDTLLGVTTRVSVNDMGVQGNLDSGGNRVWISRQYVSITKDGKYVAFQSLATNLAPGPSNGDWEIYLRGPLGL